MCTFNRTEYTSAVACLCVCCSVTFDSLQPHRLYPSKLLCSWDFPGKHTGVGSHFLLQGAFPTQGLNPCLLCLLHCRQILYHWAIWETHGGTQIERQTVGLYVLPTVPMLGATSRMQPWENNMWLTPSKLYTLWPLCKLLSFWQEVVAICLSCSHPWQASYISSLAY